jgi:hypothetical protein
MPSNAFVCAPAASAPSHPSSTVPESVATVNQEITGGLL